MDFHCSAPPVYIESESFRFPSRATKFKIQTIRVTWGVEFKFEFCGQGTHTRCLDTTLSPPLRPWLSVRIKTGTHGRRVGPVHTSCQPTAMPCAPQKQHHHVQCEEILVAALPSPVTSCSQQHASVEHGYALPMTQLAEALANQLSGKSPPGQTCACFLC